MCVCFVSHYLLLWAMGLNNKLLGYQSHLLYCNVAIAILLVLLLMPVATKDLPISPRYTRLMIFYRDAASSALLKNLVNLPTYC